MNENFSRILFLALGGVLGCLAGICLGTIVFSGLVLNAALEEEGPVTSPSLSDPGSREDREEIHQPTLAPLPSPGAASEEAPAPAGPQPVSPLPPPAVEPVSCNCSGDVYDCRSFGSWAQAQGCFQYCVSAGAGDVHLLDENGDGLVCEALR
jgi:hypothetical protein